jgi:hypothetical protein
MKFLFAVVAAALGLTLSGAATPTQAATPGCMSYAEFASFHDGDRLFAIRETLNQPGVYAGGGAGAWQYIFKECWNTGAQGELFFSVDANRRARLYAKKWNADLPSPIRVSLFEFGMMQEWLQIGLHPTRARVERIFDVQGNVAEGGDYFYPVARVGQWDRRFGNGVGGYTVYVRYRDGRMTRVYYLRTVG